jgi:hypothetical protein
MRRLPSATQKRTLNLQHALPLPKRQRAFAPLDVGEVRSAASAAFKLRDCSPIHDYDAKGAPVG